MTNTALFHKMINNYTEKAFTENYIFGFRFGGNVYMTIANHDVLAYVLKLDKASRGAGMSIRFKPTKEQKSFLLSLGSTVVCSEKFFNETVKTEKWNKGEIFEKMVTEFFGQIWKKDTIPFWKDGDITVDGIAYQIKFESATFTTEKQLAKLNA